MSSVEHASSSTPSRLPFFDNAKFFLICCVVIGHLLKEQAVNRRKLARALFAFIYVFHMPLFVFLSGLFLDRTRMTWEKTRARALRFLALGFLAKLLRAVSPWLLGDEFTFTLLSDNGIQWYMFALTAYYVLAWVLRNSDPLRVGIAAIAIALVAVYTKPIGSFLSLSRIIVFFPFFWLGFTLTPQKVSAALSHPRVRIACTVVLAAFALFCAVWPRRVYRYRKLFMGRGWHAALGPDGRSALNRLIAYLVSTTVGTAVLGVIPHQRLEPFTTYGSRTLQVYLLHYEVIDVLVHLGVIKFLTRMGHWGWLTLIPLGVAIVCLLSVRPIKIPVPTELVERWQNRNDSPAR